MGMKTGAATMENSMENKIKNKITISSSNLTPGHISSQKYNSKKIHKALCSLQHCSQYPRHGNNINVSDVAHEYKITQLKKYK